MAFILAGCAASLTYIGKDYYDSTERGMLYSRIANARIDERHQADKRVDDVRSYYAALSVERDARVAQLTEQNDELLNLNKIILALIQSGQVDRKKAVELSQKAVAKATEAANIATATNKTLGAVVNKEKPPEGTVKKLNDKIKDVNRK